MYIVDRGWLYGSVKPYFELKGIKLLKDDMEHIEKCLGKIPPDRHRVVIRGYFERWNTKTPENPSSETRAFNSRYEANYYLLNASD